MPELPEVETVRRTLKPAVIGKTFHTIDVRFARMVLPETPESFTERLKGQTINDIKRLGKYLIFVLSQDTLLVHLRMEGKFFIKPSSVPISKHEHVIFYFTDQTSLRYDDVRKFGTLTIKKPADVYITPPLSLLGYEPHHPHLTVAYLKEKFASTRMIKPVLLDQTIILGLGNIYVDEVLFCAKIKPTQRAHRLSKNTIDKIITCAEKVIDKAIALGGSSIRSYTDSLGVTGRFQNELMVHLRQGEPCKVCATPIVKTKVAQRGTYYCPRCQSGRKK